MLAKEAEKRKSRAQKGHHPPSKRGHRQKEGDRQRMPVHRRCQEGLASSEKAPEERAAAFVSLEAEPSREWVRQESGRQLLERHSLVF